MGLLGGQKVRQSRPHEYQQPQRGALYTLVTSEASKAHEEEKGRDQRAAPHKKGKKRKDKLSRSNKKKEKIK